MSSYNMTFKCNKNVNDLVLNNFTDTSRLTCEEWFTCPYPANDPEHHSDHFMDFNLNTNELCLAFGQPCNECIDKANTPPKSSIICYNTDTAKNILDGTIWASGVRNSYGHKFHPKTGKMYVDTLYHIIYILYSFYHVHPQRFFVYNVCDI